MRKYLPLTRLIVCLFVGQLLLAASGYSQDGYAYSSSQTKKKAEPKQQKDSEKQTLFTVLKDLNKTRGVYFLFSEKDMAEIKVNPVKDQQASVEKILQEILNETGLKYKKVSDNTFVILKEKQKAKTGSIYSEPDFSDDNTTTQNVIQT